MASFGKQNASMAVLLDNAEIPQRTLNVMRCSSFLFFFFFFLAAIPVIILITQVTPMFYVPLSECQLFMFSNTKMFSVTSLPSCFWLHRTPTVKCSKNKLSAPFFTHYTDPIFSLLLQGVCALPVQLQRWLLQNLILILKNYHYTVQTGRSLYYKTLYIHYNFKLALHSKLSYRAELCRFFMCNIL